MTYEIFSSLKSHIIRWPRHLLMAGGLCLLVACGGGGGGGSSNAYAIPGTPTVSLTRSDGGASVYSGNTALLLPQFSYGSGSLSWSDSSGAHTQAVSAGTPVQVTPTATTRYTLTVQYQDPTTVRTSILSTSASMDVTVIQAPTLAPTLSLTPSATTITSGSSVTLTPVFSVPAGLSLTSSVIEVNGDTTTPISATSGIAVVQAPTANASYKLKLNYVDTRVVPNTSASMSVTTAVAVTSSATKIGLAGELRVARSDFTATPLQNGMVLVAGGIDSTGTVLKSVELYDPITNQWTLTGEMKTARRGHSATLLRDGRVLVSGGYEGVTAATVLNKAETYDSGTGAWTASGTLNEARRWHTSTLLNNDKVLIAGGSVSSGRGTVTELFDPTLGTFTATTSSLSVPRQGHTATLLPNGKVLVAGRNDSDGSIYNSSGGLADASTTEFFDPSTSLWSAGPTMNYRRYQHAATLLSAVTGKVLVTGGSGAGADTAEVLELSGANYVWTKVNTGMSVPRAFHTSTLLNTGEVLITGGYNATSQFLNTTELFTLNSTTASSSWSSASSNKELNIVRAMHVSIKLSNGNVLILGTYYSISGTVSNMAEIWAP